MPRWLQLLLLVPGMLLLQWMLLKTPLLLHLPKTLPLPRPVLVLLPVVQPPPRLLLAAMLGEIDPLALRLGIIVRQGRPATGVRLRYRCICLGVMVRQRRVAMGVCLVERCSVVRRVAMTVGDRLGVHLVGEGLGVHLEVRAVGRRLRRGALRIWHRRPQVGDQEERVMPSRSTPQLFARC